MDEPPVSVKIPPCETPGCCRTRGHALSPPDTPCLPPLGPITHRRIAYPTAEGMARIRAEWAKLRGH